MHSEHLCLSLKPSAEQLVVAVDCYVEEMRMCVCSISYH